jgi:hypothetical protein
MNASRLLSGVARGAARRPWLVLALALALAAWSAESSPQMSTSL